MIEFLDLPEFESSLNGFEDWQVPEIREIAARTQVGVEYFSECPNCGESMFDRLMLCPMPTWVEFGCKSCKKTGNIHAGGEVTYL